MTPDAIAADSSLLSMDQAVAELAAEIDKDDKAPAAAETPEGTNTEAGPAAEDASEPEAVTDGEDAETEDAEAAEEAKLPAIEPPRFWDAEAKARFGELPRDIQELLSQNEDRSVKATSKSLQEAAEARKAADFEASNLTALRSQLDKHIETAKTRFKSKYAVLDQFPDHSVYWNALIDEVGADRALKFKNEFDADQAAIAQAERDATVAKSTDLANFKAREMAKLPELAPDLVDPKTAPQRFEAIRNALRSANYNDEQIQWIDAFQVAAMNDALKWREANANAKAQIGLPKTPAKTATPGKPSVKPTAAPGRSGSPQHSRMQQLSRKPSLSMDEAVELMDLEESLK